MMKLIPLYKQTCLVFFFFFEDFDFQKNYFPIFRTKKKIEYQKKIDLIRDYQKDIF